jgi:hypothetical protein
MLPGNGTKEFVFPDLRNMTGSFSKTIAYRPYRSQIIIPPKSGVVRLKAALRPTYFQWRPIVCIFIGSGEMLNIKLNVHQVFQPPSLQLPPKSKNPPNR